MNQVTKDMKDFAAFFDNAAKAIEAAEKDAAMLRAELKRKNQLYSECRLHIAKYENCFRDFGFPVPARPQVLR